MQNPVLDIRDLNLEFPVFGGCVHALNGVNLKVMPGEIVGVVGESGSGKSVTAMTALRLLPKGSYKVTSGSVHLLGSDILSATEKTVRQWRGRLASMIFQEPMTALNPTQKIAQQMSAVLRLHQLLNKQDSIAKAADILRDMMISEPDQVLNSYPFELSGGMRQRVMVAMAFSCDPKLLVADEPTTALDVTVQRQVLQLLRKKAKEKGTAILFITHDMAVVSLFCDRVYVMYAGTVLEQGTTKEVLNNPLHPYTKGLLDGLPELAIPGESLAAIPGQVPDLRKPQTACVFYDRCAFADEKCLVKPELKPINLKSINVNANNSGSPNTAGAEMPDNRAVACWHPLQY